ncbi:MAG: VCBS repeat-containing protein, partial [Phycisphaeraceae bacterium]|nr:VCBS repeat-containing protein [Phycisphaeraceae bacterium]
DMIQSTIPLDFDDFVYGDPFGEIAIWDADGNSLPGWPQGFFTDFESNVMTAVGDIDGDGAFELIVVDDYLLTVNAFNTNGELVEGLWPIEVGPWWAYISSDPVLADLDQDGDSEIIVALDAESSTDDGLFAIQGDGSYLWERRYTSHGPLSVADIDGDGDVEIALSGFGPGISNVHTFLLDHQGQQIKRWRGGSPKGTVISDLDGDGEQELLFCTDKDVQAVHVDGSVVWRAQVFEPLDTAGGLSVGDLDSDGRGEVYVTSFVEGDGFQYTKVYGFDHTGRMLDQQGYPKVLMGNASRTVPLIADVDADGAKELLVAAGGAPTTAWEADGSVTPGFPLLDPLHDFYTVPAIQDLDQDGDLEFILLGNDSRLHVFDLASPSLPGSVDWGHVRHDPQNTGWTAPLIEMDPIEAPAQVSPGEKLLMQAKVSDSENQWLRYAVGGLPEGAFYDDDTHTVTWKATTDQAFHTYDLFFLVTDGIRQDNRILSVTVTPGAIYHADMDTDPNWTLDNGWAWGVPTGEGAWDGDPNSGHTGENVLGYVLEGDYSNLLSEPRYATTTAIDCSGYKDIRLAFWRWLGLESPYDQAQVQISNDGANWVDLWTSGNFHISDDAWQFVEYAAPAEIADNQSTVYFRWGLGPTDDSVASPGWNIDDVQITGERMD